ncbi:MAG: helix-turn-helix transcriptional regulator [Patescibacteria group bacterium]
MEDVYGIIGQKVRAYRTRLGWTQEGLGEKASLHPSFIGQIERGVKKISIVTLQKLSKALRVKMSNLLDEEPLPYQPSRVEAEIIRMVREKPEKQQEYVLSIIQGLSRFSGRKS